MCPHRASSTLETRQRAVRMYRDRLRDHDESRRTARRHIGGLLDINPETLRNWIEREEIDSVARPGTTTDAAAELKQLRKENAELRQAPRLPLASRVRAALP